MKAMRHDKNLTYSYNEPEFVSDKKKSDKDSLRTQD